MILSPVVMIPIRPFLGKPVRVFGTVYERGDMRRSNGGGDEDRCEGEDVGDCEPGDRVEV